MKEFSKAVCEKIGYYVYVLKDPRSSIIFYIGKGLGNRVFQHISCALATSAESDKLNLIREINLTSAVEHYILRHGLLEEQAIEIESACIDLLGIDNLTNAIKGHYSWERGLKTVDEVIQHYDAKVISITEPSIIININRLYKRFMTDIELYEATRKSWVVGNRKDSAQYAIASYHGLVREVYTIDEWYKTGGRWGFNGKKAPDEIRIKYLNQSLDKYITKGGRNPVRYSF